MPPAPGPFTVSFDYTYEPRVRNFSVGGGNPFRMMLEDRQDDFSQLLTRMRSKISPLSNVSLTAPADGALPFWDNGWFPVLDAISIYGLVAVNSPRRYIEVGSGNSTKFVRRAVTDHRLSTRITSIDPHPRAEIDALCDQVIRSRLEDADLSLFETLEPNDLVFIDNSHRSFQGSDVTVFFTEVLTRLPRGVVWGLHDIFIPNDYPSTWTERYYSEQYLLMTYLLGGGGSDVIELPVHFLESQPKLSAKLTEPFGDSPPWQSVHPRGGAFWMRRT